MKKKFYVFIMIALAFVAVAAFSVTASASVAMAEGTGVPASANNIAAIDLSSSNLALIIEAMVIAALVGVIGAILLSRYAYGVDKQKSQPEEKSKAAEEAKPSVPEQVVVEKVTAPIVVVAPVVEEVVEEEPVVEAEPIVEESAEELNAQDVIDTIANGMVQELDSGAVVRVEDGSYVYFMYNKSFTAKLIQANDEVRDYYNILKNHVLSYKKVNSRISWNYENFNYGRNKVVRFVLRGKSLYLYLPLNADDYADTKYKVEKAESKRYEEIPCLYRIKNPRRVKYAMELIDTVMEKFGLKRVDRPAEDYVAAYPYEETLPLIERNLIKVVRSKFIGNSIESFEIVEEGAQVEEQAKAEPAIVEESVVESIVEAPVEEPAVEEITEEPVEEAQPEEEPVAEEPVEEEQEVVEVIVFEEEPAEEVQPEEEPAVEETAEEELVVEEETQPEEELAEEPQAEEEPAAEEPAAEEESVEEEAVEEVQPEEEPAVEEEPAEEPAAEEEPAVEETAEEELVVEEETQPEEELAEEPQAEEEPAAEEPAAEEESVEEEAVEEVQPEEEPAVEETAEEEPVVEEEPAEEPAEEEEPAVEEEAQAEEPVVVEEPLKEVQVYEVDSLMTDAEANAKVQHSARHADTTKKGIVNIDTLSAVFNDGETVTLDAIKKRVSGFNKKVTYIKVLARGRLNKRLTVEADEFSIDAEKMILLTGGQVIKTLS